MTVSLSMLAGAGAQFLDDNGDPLSGGLLYTYFAGTTSDATTFMTSAGHAGGDNANPIVLDAAGRVPYQIWLTDGVSYKFVVKTSGGVTVRTYDNMYGAQNGNILGLLAASSGSSLVGFLQAGAGTIASTVQAKLREYKSASDYGAVLNGSTDDTAALQTAINSCEYLNINGSAVCGGLTIPATLKGLNVEGTLKANGNNVTVMQFLNDTTRTHIKTIRRIRIDGNGYTGVTGLLFGAETDNPSPGAWEAVLYVTGDDIYVTSCETGMHHVVTMEHHFKQTVLINNTVGLKMYSDPVNGGCNANRFDSLRLQSNGVGAIIKNRTASYTFPLHQNYFGSLILQGNSICGMAFIGADAQQIDNVHIESNGGGAASISIDGYTVPKCDILVAHSSVYINDTDHASAASLTNGSILVQDYGRFVTNGLTGYGSNGLKIACDATSTYYETGPVNACGQNNNLASYGQIAKASGLGITSGAPILKIGRGKNSYAGTNPMFPDVSNLVGTVSSQLVKSEFGLTPEVTFSASTGSTATNRLYMNLLTGGASEYQISSILVNPSANCSFVARFFAGASQVGQPISLVGNVWTRITFISYGATNHQLYFYPNDSTGASVKFQAVQCLSTTDIAQISEIYQNGTVNVQTELYNRYSAAPTTGTWAVGDVVYNSAPAAGGTIGWVCTTAGTPGTWKTWGNITP